MQRWMKTAALLCSAATLSGAAMAQTQGTLQTTNKLADKPPVTYDNKYEVYGGIGLQTFQAGQQLPKKMVFGTTELQGTYWLTRKLGLAADFRGGAGTTDVFPNTDPSRPLVVQYTGMGGVQYRGPKNQFAAINYHAFFGASHGVFDETARQDLYIGLYTNRTAPMGAVGGSLDINRSKNLAFRLSPDLIVEHYGDETREFFGLSGGILYRFGKN